MVRLCFALLLLHKEQDRIHMPRRLIANLKGEVIDEKFHECALGHNIPFVLRVIVQLPQAS